jgi:hypothetical protein
MKPLYTDQISATTPTASGCKVSKTRLSSALVFSFVQRFFDRAAPTAGKQRIIFA